MSKLIQHQSSLFTKTFTNNLHTPNKSTNSKISNAIVSPPPTQYLASQSHIPTDIQISIPKLNKSQLQYKDLQSLLSAQKKKKIRNQIQRKKEKEKQRQKDDQFSIILQQFCENENSINKNQVKVICQYCQQQKAVFSCDNCNKSIYCQSCFTKVHSSQKFKFHKAITINKFTQITSSFQNLTLDSCQPQKNILKQSKNNQKQKQTKISKQIITNQIINLKIKRQQFASILQQNKLKIQAKWKQLQQKAKEQFIKIKQSVQKEQDNVLQQIKILREYELKAYSIKNLLKIEKIIQNLQKIKHQQKIFGSFEKIINKTKQISNQTQQKLNNYRKTNNNSYNFSKISFDQIKLALNKVVLCNIFIKDTAKTQHSVLGQSRQTQQNYIQPGNQQNRFFLYKKCSKNKLPNQTFKNQQQQLYSQNTTLLTTSNITLDSIPENQTNQKIKKVKSEKVLPFQISYPYSLKIQKRNKIGQGETKKHC